MIRRSLQIGVIQVNVNTLKSDVKSRLLYSQFQQENAHIIGMQERRTKHTGVSVRHGYIIAEAAADSDGSGGCAVLVSAKLPFSDATDGEDMQTGVKLEDVNLLEAHRDGYLRESRHLVFKR